MHFYITCTCVHGTPTDKHFKKFLKFSQNTHYAFKQPKKKKKDNRLIRVFFVSFLKCRLNFRVRCFLKRYGSCSGFGRTFDRKASISIVKYDIRMYTKIRNNDDGRQRTKNDFVRFIIIKQEAARITDKSTIINLRLESDRQSGRKTKYMVF